MKPASDDWYDFGAVFARNIQYQPVRKGSPTLHYCVFRRINGSVNNYYLCTEVSRDMAVGMLNSFDDVLIGEHFTPTPCLNVVKCMSGVYPGFGECTLQLAIQKDVWNVFMPLYYALLDYGIDWTNLFDLGLRSLIRYLTTPS